MEGFAGLANGVHDQALNPGTGDRPTRVCGHVGNHYGSIVEVLCPIREVASCSRPLAATEGYNVLDDGQVLQPAAHKIYLACCSAFPGSKATTMLRVHSATMAPTDEHTWFHLHGANHPLWCCVEASVYHPSHVIAAMTLPVCSRVSGGMRDRA